MWRFVLYANHFCQNLTVTGMYRQTLVKITNMNFTNLHLVGVALYYADRQDEANIHLSQMPCKRT